MDAGRDFFRSSAVSAVPGICRHCGCGVSRLCRLENTDTCCWIDESRTVCSNPSCIVAEQARLKAAGRKHGDKYRGWGYGAVVKDMRRKASRAKRKGRAA